MKNYLLIVLSNPVEGKEKEFETWYVERHIPDCLRIPGFFSGKLLPSAPEQHPLQQESKWGHIAMFELRTENVGCLLAELNSRLNTSEMPVSDAFSFENFHIQVFEVPVR